VFSPRKILTKEKLSLAKIHEKPLVFTYSIQQGAGFSEFLPAPVAACEVAVIEEAGGVCTV